MNQATRPAFINCERCGAEKAVGRSGPVPTYCSASCRAATKYARSREDGRYEAALAAARQRTADRRAANARPCPFCNAPMTNPRSKRCSDPECRRAAYTEWMREWQRTYRAEHGQWYHRRYAAQQREYNRRRYRERPHWRVRYPGTGSLVDARRRARVEAACGMEPVVPTEVYARDGWTCRLCLLPIDPEIAWPSLMSASVDHIIPLSRGGLHSMINVQSAHLSCNASKGDGLTVERIKI